MMGTQIVKERQYWLISLNDNTFKLENCLKEVRES